MWGLRHIRSVEIQSIGSNAKYGWHISHLVLPLSHIHKMPRDRGGGGHGGGDEVRTASFALAAFEIAVARAGAALTRLQLVRVHRQTHRAARFAPLEARFFEDAVETFLLSLPLDLTAARDDHCVDRAGDLVTLDDRSRGSQVADAGVRT